MRLLRGPLLAVPFVVAGVLNALLLAPERFHWHGEHIAAYAFLFGSPWAWLLDRGWIPFPHNRFLLHVLGFGILLWVPAALYSCCIWLLLAGVRRLRSHS